MKAMAVALQASGLTPSDEVAAELERAEQPPIGSEVAPGVVFKSNFSIGLLIAGIIGDVDCRIYITVKDQTVRTANQEVQLLTYVNNFLTGHPELGSMNATIPDINSVDIHHDHLDLSRRWVGIHCRNATIAWEITAAMRSVTNWPCAVGKITCPKVEQMLRRNGINADSY